MTGSGLFINSISSKILTRSITDIHDFFNMNRGSEWRIWDLHFHTPASYDYKNKSVTGPTVTISTAVDSVGYCGFPQYNKEIIVNVLDFSKDMDLLVNSLDPGWQQTHTPWTYYYNNEPVTEIPEVITSIGKYQFCAYNQAASITIPSSVTKIGVYAFSSNNGIRSSITSITCLATEPPTFEGSYLYPALFTFVITSLA